MRNGRHLAAAIIVLLAILLPGNAMATAAHPGGVPTCGTRTTPECP